MVFCDDRYQQAIIALDDPVPSLSRELDESDLLEQFLLVPADDDGHIQLQCGPSSHGIATDRNRTPSESADVPLICLWADCGQLFCALDQLVEHIELHVDQRGGTEACLPRGGSVTASSLSCDEFICLWSGCGRQRRPFNARYKLLIHMRVHSGEKPHKCTVYRTT